MPCKNAADDKRDSKIKGGNPYKILKKQLKNDFARKKTHTFQLYNRSAGAIANKPEGSPNVAIPFFHLERTWPYYGVRPCLYKRTIFISLKSLRPEIRPSEDAPPFVTYSPGGVEDLSFSYKKRKHPLLKHHKIRKFCSS